jgi:hypothetical protein
MALLLSLPTAAIAAALLLLLLLLSLLLLWAVVRLVPPAPNCADLTAQFPTGKLNSTSDTQYKGDRLPLCQ